MKKTVFTLTRIMDKHDNQKFYYTVDNGAFKWFFYSLVKAESFIENENGVYNYKEVYVDGLI